MQTNLIVFMLSKGKFIDCFMISACQDNYIVANSSPKTYSFCDLMYVIEKLANFSSVYTNMYINHYYKS